MGIRDQWHASPPQQGTSITASEGSRRALHPPSPLPPPRRHGDGRHHHTRRPAPRPWKRVVGLFAVVLLGAWLGLLIVGNVRVPVGPMDTTMTLRPSLTGGTKINVSPLGALELDSHQAPVRLDVNVDQLDPARSQALVDRPERLSGLQDEVTQDIARGTADLAVRSVVAVVTGATALGLAVYRRPRRALAAGGLALTLLAASGGTAYATWNPDSVLEPRFSGLLSSAPSLVGNARSIVTEFDVYQKELARLVTNVTKLYDATSTLPAYQPDPTTLRVLHVSDIHLNPASWAIIASLVEQYQVDVIVDSGDTMDHGTAAENGFLDPIEDLGAPYVWVRGNHDSLAPSAISKASRTSTSWTTDGPGPSRACASPASATRSSPRTAPRNPAPSIAGTRGRPSGLRPAGPAGRRHPGQRGRRP
ncbi:3',5'-cyclic adenosine monophosphate phosphodiesterase CpdA [Streptomyces hirsutus]